MRDTEIFRLSFVAADQNQPPVVIRIRHLLKYALRSVGLICVDMDDGRGEVVHNPDLAAWQAFLRKYQEEAARIKPGDEEPHARGA